MPSRSSAISSDSASTRSKLMFVVFGTRGVARAVDGRAGHRARMPRLEPIAQRREPRRFGRSFAARQPRGDAQADDRRRRSRCRRAGCAPACRRSTMRQQPHAAPDPERADALRSVELVRRQRQQVDAERATSTGILPTVCTASVWNSAPRSCAIAASSATGWIVPISLLACITETSAVSSVSASRSAAGETMPVVIDRAAAWSVQPRRASALTC